MTNLHADGNLLGHNVHIIKRERLRILRVANKEISMDVNVEKNKQMIMYREQNAEHKHNREMANQFFEDVAKLKYFAGDTNKRKLHSRRN